MSEYQYYEFQAIDRALSSEEQKEIANISSRVKLTARSAAFTYHYSNLKANPEELLLKFYDIYFYISNFGVRGLMFKFPKDLVDIDALKAYCIEYYLTVETKDEFVILNLNHVNEECGGDWIDGEDWLAPLLCLREDILSGDYRAVYIAWLAIAQITNLDEDTLEPHVPAGLNKLSTAHKTLIELYELDTHFFQAACEASPSCEEKVLSDEDRLKVIKEIPQDELNEILVSLSKGKANLSIELNNRIQKFSGNQSKQNYEATQKRSLKDISAIAKKISESEVCH